MIAVTEERQQHSAVSPGAERSVATAPADVRFGAIVLKNFWNIVV
jgi:hypothetical protein